MTIIEAIEPIVAALNTNAAGEESNAPLFLHGEKSYQNIKDDVDVTNGVVYLDEPILSQDKLNLSGYLEEKYLLGFLFGFRGGIDLLPNDERPLINAARELRRRFINLLSLSKLIRRVDNIRTTDITKQYDLSLSGCFLQIDVTPLNQLSNCLPEVPVVTPEPEPEPEPEPPEPDTIECGWDFSGWDGLPLANGWIEFAYDDSGTDVGPGGACGNDITSIDDIACRINTIGGAIDTFAVSGSKIVTTSPTHTYSELHIRDGSYNIVFTAPYACTHYITEIYTEDDVTEVEIQYTSGQWMTLFIVAANLRTDKPFYICFPPGDAGDHTEFTTRKKAKAAAKRGYIGIAADRGIFVTPDNDAQRDSVIYGLRAVREAKYLAATYGGDINRVVLDGQSFGGLTARQAALSWDHLDDGYFAASSIAAVNAERTEFTSEVLAAASAPGEAGGIYMSTFLSASSVRHIAIHGDGDIVLDPAIDEAAIQAMIDIGVTTSSFKLITGQDHSIDFDVYKDYLFMKLSEVL